MSEVRNELAYYGQTGDVVRKSNALMLSKGYGAISGLAYDIINIAVSRIEAEAELHNPNDVKLVARLYPTELCRLIPQKGKNIYRELAAIAKLITSQSVLIHHGDSFESFAVITNADYTPEHVFEITFNQSIRKHVLSLSSQYTVESIATLTMLNNIREKRLYEALKTAAYKIQTKDGIEKPAVMDIRFRELLFIMGICSIDSKPVATYLAKLSSSDIIDYDYIYENILPESERSYQDWYTFSKFLKKCLDTIKKKTDIRAEMEGLREGRFIKTVRFFIYHNTPEAEVLEQFNRTNEALRKNSTEEYLQMEYPSALYPDLYEEFEGHNYLTVEDIDILIRTTAEVTEDNKYDEKLVRRAIEAADKQPHLSNYVGWMRSYIRNGGYKQSIEVIDGSAEKAIALNQIKEETAKPEVKIEAGKRAWMRITKREEFDDFVAFAEKENDMPWDVIDSIYSESEKTTFYCDWKSGRPVIWE